MDDETGNTPEIDKANPVWKYFEVLNEEDGTAICNSCHELFSFKNGDYTLKRHLERKHSNVVLSKKSDDEEEEHLEAAYLEDDDNDDSDNDKRKLRRNEAWDYFEVTDEAQRKAICTLCREEFSYRTTSSNLTRHLKSKHFIEFKRTDFEEEPPEQETSSTSRKYSRSWDYFTIKDPVKRLATCKICNCDFSYLTSVSNLMKHARRKHNLDRSEEDNDDFDSDEKLIEWKTPDSGMRSPLWLYFKILDRLNRVAVCLICKKQFSFSTTITNLKRHLYRKHPNISLNRSPESKKMLLTSNGQLYEIEETTKQEQPDLADDEDQHAEPMEIYLDEIEGNVIENKTIAQPKKKMINSKIKRLIREDSDTNSSSDEVTLQKQYVRKTKDSLDQFGIYLVSLLRQLPKDVSNRLQADFVKQIMTCQNGDNGNFAVATETPNDLAVSSASNEEDGNVTADDNYNRITSDPAWKFFERESNERARCAVCCATVRVRSMALLEHLRNEHPKLLEDDTLERKHAEEEENYSPTLYRDSGDSENEEAYTEVIYVDETSSKEKVSYKNKLSNIPPKTHKTKKRRDSNTEDENVKRQRLEIREYDEIESFGNYLICLLKKLPTNVCMKVQKDIINLVMNAKFDSERNDNETNYYMIQKKESSDRTSAVPNVGSPDQEYSITLETEVVDNNVIEEEVK